MMLAFVMSALLWAAEPVAPVNAHPKTHIAVEGVDVVGYFEQGEVVMGSSAYTATHGGAIWHFASAAHRDAFVAQPEQYVPQFGGYCAWAVGHGYTAKIDPRAWQIVDGQLYLNYSRAIGKRWAADQEALIAAGQAHWPGLLAGETP